MKSVIFLFVFFLILSFSQAQELPDVFKLSSGEKVKTAKDWYDKRKPEIINFFSKEVYGIISDIKEYKFHYSTLENEKEVYGGKAYRKQVRMFIVNNQNDSISVDLLIYYPASAKKKPVPVFTLLNYGNHTLLEDTTIHFSVSKLYPVDKKRATFARRFPIEMILDRGCGVITSCYEDFIPDDDALFRKASESFYHIHPDSTGAISIWAWAYSRMVDYVLEQKYFDPEKVAAIGHSRTGKTALWAAANDARIKYVFVNESGNSGAKLNFHINPKSESIAKINRGFPYWFPSSYDKYNDRDSLQTLPYDQHWLLASIAPRHLYVADANKDIWSDPEGEFLSLKEAEKVYKFLGLKTFLPASIPIVGEPTTKGYCGYHIREGTHDLLPEDWINFIQFIKQ
jgi:hypothetical protein